MEFPSQSSISILLAERIGTMPIDTRDEIIAILEDVKYQTSRLRHSIGYALDHNCINQSREVCSRVEGYLAGAMPTDTGITASDLIDKAIANRQEELNG